MPTTVTTPVPNMAPPRWHVLNYLAANNMTVRHSRTNAADSIAAKTSATADDLIALETNGYVRALVNGHVAQMVFYADRLGQLRLQITAQGVLWYTNSANAVLFALRDLARVAPVKKVLARADLDDPMFLFAMEDAGLIDVTFGPPGGPTDRGPVKRTTALIDTMRRGELIHARLTHRGARLVDV